MVCFLTFSGSFGGGNKICDSLEVPDVPEEDVGEGSAADATCGKEWKHGRLLAARAASVDEGDVPDRALPTAVPAFLYRTLGPTAWCAVSTQQRDRAGSCADRRLHRRHRTVWRGDYKREAGRDSRACGVAGLSSGCPSLSPTWVLLAVVPGVMGDKTKPKPA